MTSPFVCADDCGCQCQQQLCGCRDQRLLERRIHLTQQELRKLRHETREQVRA